MKEVSPQKNKVLYGLVLLGCSLFYLLPFSCFAGTYLNSAHGGSGVSGKGLSRSTTTGYVPGNCAHCHEQHASIGGSETAPNTGNDQGPDIYLGMGYEEGLCLHCHKSFGGDDGQGGTADDINSDLNPSIGHNPADYTNKHREGEALANLNNATDWHVECVDCHNPHKAGKTNHTPGTNAITSSNPLYGVTGILANYSGASNWNITGVLAGSLSVSTHEYEVCYKCHSSANNYYSSGGGSSSLAWTDVGLEFNPQNRSFHPIVTGLNATNSNSYSKRSGNNLTTAQLKTPWDINIGTQTMYCSDCHSGDTRAGPHGSAKKWLLAGTNKAWPFTSDTYNGDSDTTGGGSWAYLNGGTANVFCFNCHDNNTSTNNVHSRNDHWGSTNGRCLNCHIRVPHGGRVSRLINAENTPGDLPARYHADGNGNPLSTGPIKQFKPKQRSSYSKINCKVSAASCKSDHNSTGSGYENWAN